MSIQVFCPACKTSSALDAKECAKCKKPFERNRKYRIQVSVKGQRVTRVVDKLSVAKELESTIKSDMVREEFDISHHKAKSIPSLNDLWEKYLPWAKLHKKTWRDDDYHYRKHIQARFGDKTLDSITSFNLEKFKIEMRKGTNKHGKPFKPATLKHQLILLRRLFNLAVKWRAYTMGQTLLRA